MARDEITYRSNADYRRGWDTSERMNPATRMMARRILANPAESPAERAYWAGRLDRRA